MRGIKQRLPAKWLVFSTVLLITLFLSTPSADAKPPDFNGGVLDEYLYEEVVFLTGYPVKFSGKAKVTEKVSNTKETTNYSFTLTSAAGDKLTRSINYEADLVARADKGQITANMKIKSYSEKITFGKNNTYTLDDYQFSQSSVSDIRPASDFYSGNVIGRKIYKTAANDLITVNLNGRNMGYENFWGATETQLINYEIVSRQGTALVTSVVSESKSKTLKYEPHEPSYSSFTGGHIVINSSNMVGEYKYDIPYGIGKGKIALSKENLPSIERLIVPKFRDLTNHWAKDDIEKLYSMGVFDESTPIFSPNTPMSRYEFTVGVLKAVNLRVLEQPKNNKTPKKAIFKDLDVKDPDYLYIESAVEKGIIKGATSDLFKPDNPITRVQAVSIFVRALGMEGRAPSPGYKTNFVDDDKIESWAKDSVYVANELGIVNGDGYNRFNPYNSLSRAQSSAMLVRFLAFLENDLKQNYRDDILFFN